MRTERFEIIFQKWRDRTSYRAMVNVYPLSEHVLHVTVRAGSKVLIMHKSLIKKTVNWDIIETNFAVPKNSREANLLFLFIQDAIDKELDKKKDTT
jgi:hypothetical protein